MTENNKEIPKRVIIVDHKTGEPIDGPDTEVIVLTEEIRGAIALEMSQTGETNGVQATERFITDALKSSLKKHGNDNAQEHK